MFSLYPCPWKSCSRSTKIRWINRVNRLNKYSLYGAGCQCLVVRFDLYTHGQIRHRSSNIAVGAGGNPALNAIWQAHFAPGGPDRYDLDDGAFVNGQICRRSVRTVCQICCVCQHDGLHRVCFLPGCSEPERNEKAASTPPASTARRNHGDRVRRMRIARAAEAIP